MHGVKRGCGVLLGIAIVLVILLFVIHQPVNAGNLVTRTFHGLGDAGDALGQFLGSLIH